MRSEVPKFGLIQAKSVSDAINLLNQYGQWNARVICGGSDVFYQLKNKIELLIPKYIIDISQLPLNYIQYSSNSGFRIGATTTLGDVEKNTDIQKYASVVSDAVSTIATHEIRNVGTVAGDILQEVWCPYLRNNYDCWRNGGNVCYGAIGDNRYYHSIFGGRLCYAIHASDLGPALLAMDASAIIQTPSGTKSMTIDSLIPGISVIGGQVKENVLNFNEIVTEIQIPQPPPNTVSAYYKVRDRDVWDFAMASAAIRLTFSSGNTVSDSRIVLGGVDVKPRRVTAAENYLKGKTLSESVFAGAADAALSDATPLPYGTGNDFRVDLCKGAVIKALRQLSSSSSSTTTTTTTGY